MTMQTVIEHKSGQVYSIKTFRPLWILPWFSSIWRQFPLRTWIATLKYENKAAAKKGHEALAAMLRDLQIGPKMSEPFEAIEAFAKNRAESGVKGYRISEGHAIEGKASVVIDAKRE
jgi:hypothetical protein